jgi:CubicO group peptidase (beta-lactamase class C family)
MTRHAAGWCVLGAVALVLLPAAVVSGAAAQRRADRETAAAMPLSGVAAPGMASFDRVVPAFMERWRIPGGAVAVVKAHVLAPAGISCMRLGRTLVQERALA